MQCRRETHRQLVPRAHGAHARLDDPSSLVDAPERAIRADAHDDAQRVLARQAVQAAVLALKQAHERRRRIRRVEQVGVRRGGEGGCVVQQRADEVEGRALVSGKEGEEMVLHVAQGGAGRRARDGAGRRLGEQEGDEARAVEEEGERRRVRR